MQVLSERWLIPPYGVPVWVHLEFTHLFVPLRQVAKVLSLGNEKKKVFLLHFTRFLVTLASPKILTLGNTQINLVFRSLIRTFAAKSTLNLWKSRINLPRN